MTDLDLAAIEARCEKATKGPWRTDMHGSEVWTSVLSLVGRPVLLAFMNDTEDGHHQDATFIAHARTDVPDLCARVRRETKRADDAEAEVRRITADNERMRRGLADMKRYRLGVRCTVACDRLLAGLNVDGSAGGLRLECNHCGGTAAVLDERAVQPDQEVRCGECGTRYIVNVNEDGTDVWLAEADDAP